MRRIWNCVAGTYRRLPIRRDRLHLALELRRASLEDLQVLVRQLLQHVRRHVLVHVAVPGFAFARVGNLKGKFLLNWIKVGGEMVTNLPSGPLAGDVNAERGDHRRLVLQTHRR